MTCYRWFAVFFCFYNEKLDEKALVSVANSFDTHNFMIWFEHFERYRMKFVKYVKYFESQQKCGKKVRGLLCLNRRQLEINTKCIKTAVNITRFNNMLHEAMSYSTENTQQSYRVNRCFKYSSVGWYSDTHKNYLTHASSERTWHTNE